MVTEQKRAWFIVVLFVVVALAFAVVAVVADWRIAPGAFGIFGLGGLTPLLFRKPRDDGEVEMDERDSAIAARATRYGAIASYEAMLLMALVPWFVLYAQGRESISVHYLPQIVFVGMIVLFTARAIVTLVLYRRGVSHDEA